MAKSLPEFVNKAEIYGSGGCESVFVAYSKVRHERISGDFLCFSLAGLCV